ncbi:MAG: hypothetical protein PHF67_00470 [Candidatus Nanoarchaeia archaeon]|nr:hypothetical protein [Candidatus Nanoarchaeia archaeon]
MVTKKRKKESEISKNQDDKILFAFLAAFLSIIGFLLALITRKDDKYVMFYAKQSLVVFIIGAIAGIIANGVKFIPIIGTIIYGALFILIFLAWFLSWIYALSGKEKDIPIISYWAEKINL